MSSVAVLSGAIAIFVITALLFWQSHHQGMMEPFVTPPVAGRPYGAAQLEKDPYFIPADLNRASIASAATAIPTTATRPNTIPGPALAPRDLPATQKDLQELDVLVMAWLEALDQRENDHPGTLTPEQKQQRVIFQSRLANLRSQLGNGMITDSSRQVTQEIIDMRHQNNAWKKEFPTLEELHRFGIGRRSDAFLTQQEYEEFRALFDAGLNELKNHPQPDPLERVRFQQLQVFQQDLISAVNPPIRMGSARLFLIQMLKPDQPLPTLFAMESAEPIKPHSDSLSDVLSSLQDVQWKLQISNDPAEQALKQAVASMLDSLQIGGRMMTPHEIEVARTRVAALRSRRAPVAYSTVPNGLSLAGSRPSTIIDRAPVPNDQSLAGSRPSTIIDRARTLCTQITAAFGEGDAEALGCPVWREKAIEDEFQAETVINQVCSRLRSSVPTVDPAQFNCPRRRV